MIKTRWTKREDNILRSMRAENASTPEIAARIGRTYSGVKRRAQWLGLVRYHRRTDYRSETKSRFPLRAREIAEIVRKFHRMDERHFYGSHRTRRYCYPRQMAMYLLVTLTNLSLPQIAGIFGKDHTTVIYAGRAVASRMEDDPHVALVVTRLFNLVMLRCAQIAAAMAWDEFERCAATGTDS